MSNNNNSEFKLNIIFSLLRALWGEISSNFIVISLEFLTDEDFILNFYCINPFDEDTIEVISCVETEIISDNLFPKKINILKYNTIEETQGMKIYVKNKNLGE